MKMKKPIVTRSGRADAAALVRSFWSLSQEKGTELMKMPIVAGVAVALALSGCSVQVKMNEKNETDMGSHHVVVKPGSTFTSSSSSSGGDTETYQYS